MGDLIHPHQEIEMGCGPDILRPQFAWPRQSAPVPPCCPNHLAVTRGLSGLDRQAWI